MSDPLNTLLQQRFQGHEAPVDPHVWEGVRQQLAAAGAGGDEVNELFKERFKGHEVPVDPSAWVAISGQLGHAVAAGSASGSVWAWVAAGATAVAVSTAVWFGGGSGSAPSGPVVAVTEVMSPVAEQVRSAEPVAPSPADPVGKVERTHEHAVTRSGAARWNPSPKRTAPVAMVDERMERPVPQTAEPMEAPVEQHGPAVVSDIINVLEEQVWHRPVTAKPEPGLTTTPRSDTTGDRVVHTPASTEPAKEPLTPLPKLFMANTFTPNGDGVNDTYYVEGEGYAMILMRVYSMKTNALVFSTNSAEPWTGEGCEDGMYMVAMEAHTADGRSTTEGKVVWLTRNRMN